MARITLDNLAHSYLDAPQKPEDFALKSLDLAFDDGGAYALLGPSGCGKTSLLNIISGLVNPSRGAVRFDDRDVTRLPTEARNIAQVFQFPVVYDTMSVEENLAFPLRNRGYSESAAMTRVKEVAERLGLSADLKRRARGLTADQKQKISLGRGLVRPDVGAILFDEPLTVIDPHLKWLLRGQLKKVQDETKVTMIYVTHDQTEAMTFADKVVVMYDGEVVQIGTPQDLFERPAHTFVGYFIGSPGMNVLPASVSGATAKVGDSVITLARAYDSLPPGARIEIGIRPEFLRLTEDGGGLPATLKRVEDIGRLTILRCEMFGAPVSALAPEGTSIGGAEIRLRPDPEQIHVYANGHLVTSHG